MVYYGSLILFFGAEFTRAYVKQTGTKIATTDYAVPATKEQCAQEGMAGGKDTGKPVPTPSGHKAFRGEPYAGVKGLAQEVANPADRWLSQSLMLIAGFTGAWLLSKKRRQGSH